MCWKNTHVIEGHTVDKKVIRHYIKNCGESTALGFTLILHTRPSFYILRVFVFFFADTTPPPKSLVRRQSGVLRPDFVGICELNGHMTTVCNKT